MLSSGHKGLLLRRLGRHLSSDPPRELQAVLVHAVRPIVCYVSETFIWRGDQRGYLVPSSAAEYIKWGMQGDVSSCIAATSSSSNSPGSASAMVNLVDSPLRTCGADSVRPPKLLQPKTGDDSFQPRAA